jgi:hypothetical protein
MRFSVQNTLLTLVWLPVLCDRSVDMKAGSAIFMLCRPSMFSNGCMRSRFSVVKRCAFLGSSHSGWCRLKSPIHIMCRGVVVHCCLSRSRMYDDTWVSELLLLQLLYMLIIRSVPKLPCISSAVMSGCSKYICFQALEVILALTRITD